MSTGTIDFKKFKEMIEAQTAKGLNPVDAFKPKPTDTELFEAVRGCDFNAVYKRLENGGDACSVDWAGYTPLHYAASKKEFDIALLLLDRGADVNAKTRDQEVAVISQAVLFGDKRMVELMIAEGADVNAVDKTGFSPLHYAARINNPEFVSMLLEAGAKPELKDAEGLTPHELAKDMGARGVIDVFESRSEKQHLEAVVANDLKVSKKVRV